MNWHPRVGRKRPLIEINAPMPNDLNAELGLLGCLLLEWSWQDIKASDFYDAKHGWLYQAIRGAFHSGGGCGPWEVLPIISKKPEPDCSWVDYMIYDCMESCEGLSFVGEYAQRVKAAAVKRARVGELITELRAVYA